MVRLLTIAAVLMPLAGQAAPQKSCPPLGVMPDYLPEDAVIRNYAVVPIDGLDDQGAPAEIMVAGRLCTITYRLKDGATTLSNLEVQTNYRQALQTLGATLQVQAGRDTTAKLSRAGVDTWFRVYGGEDSYELTVLTVQAPKFTLLPPSGNDYRLVGHMPDFVAAKPVIRGYDSMTFPVIENDAEKEVAAQGRTTFVSYEYKSAKDPLTNDEISFNYREAFKAMGAEILYTSGRDTVARVLKDGQVIWMRAYAGETSIEVSALEEKPFEASIKPPPPAQLQASLAQTGRVVLYVNFDFDKATLRPDAAAVVAQVAAALKADAGLRLTIEGHTDALGTAEHNRKLSADRAASFAAALAAQGIAPSRLTSAGFGPDKPIAPNDTSEGRAKNRRVELVRM